LLHSHKEHSPLASEKECMSHAGECVRLAGLTDDLTVRDQLLDLARDWIFAAQQGHRRSDDAREVPLRKNQDDHNDKDGRT